MRNWNTLPEPTHLLKPFVWIVPMRNWNAFSASRRAAPRTGLDRTYEELKLQIERWTGGFQRSVWIVPMRNWNSHRTPTGEVWTSFGSYLWGIETIVSEGAHITLALVWIVPMRNWNNRITADGRYARKKFGSYLWGIETNMGRSTFRFSAPTVWIVPMRNWN